MGIVTQKSNFVIRYSVTQKSNVIIPYSVTSKTVKSNFVVRYYITPLQKVTEVTETIDTRADWIHSILNTWADWIHSHTGLRGNTGYVHSHS